MIFFFKITAAKLRIPTVKTNYKKYKKHKELALQRLYFDFLCMQCIFYWRVYTHCMYGTVPSPLT